MERRVADADAKTLPAGAKSSLVPRIVSAAVLAPFLLAAVWLGGWVFLALMVVAAAILVQEWNRLTAGSWVTVLAALEAIVIVVALALVWRGMVAQALLFAAAGACLAGLLAYVAGTSPIWGAAAVPYLGLPLVSLVWLRLEFPAGAAMILWLLALVWFCDTAAYFTGKRFGGPKLAPRISPKKTWSGAIGGALAGTLVGASAAFVHGWAAIPVMAGIALILSVWAQLGDLAESYIKRQSGAKDSGTIIPGHGGLLDRLDSLLFAAPAVALLVYWLEWGGVN